MRLLNVAVATSVLVAVSSAPVGDIYPTAGTHLCTCFDDFDDITE